MAKYKIIPSSRTIVQSPISIGHKAEKGVEAIEFDLTAWVETYGSGTLTVIMRRWGDAIPYPIALEIDENNKATWTLSDIDTAKAGMAYAQLSYIVGDEVVKKSDIYTFRVMDSLTGEGEPPEAYESWLENLTHLAAEAMAEVLDIEGIVTDKTLTVDGGIADGKATGDALALKADKSTTYTKSDVDALIESVDVETDTTLSVSGKPADAKTVGDELGAINESLGDVKADLDDNVNDLKSDISDRTDDMNAVVGAKTGRVLFFNDCEADTNFFTTSGDALEITGSNLLDPSTRIDKKIKNDSGNEVYDVSSSYFSRLIPVKAGLTLQPSFSVQRYYLYDSSKAFLRRTTINDYRIYPYTVESDVCYVQVQINVAITGDLMLNFGDSSETYEAFNSNTDGNAYDGQCIANSSSNETVTLHSWIREVSSSLATPTHPESSIPTVKAVADTLGDVVGSASFTAEGTIVTLQSELMPRLKTLTTDDAVTYFGQNIFDSNTRVSRKIKNDSGTEVADYNSNYYSRYIPVTDKTIKANFDIQRIYLYDSSKGFISRTSAYTKGSQISFASNVKFVQIQVEVSKITGSMCIVYGDGDTTYKAFWESVVLTPHPNEDINIVGDGVTSISVDVEVLGVKAVIPAVKAYPMWEPTTATDAYKCTPLGQSSQSIPALTDTLGYIGFLETYFDTYLGEYSDGYSVTREDLGLDSGAEATGNIASPIYSYTFAPKHYNKTVLLSAGMNTCEASTFFGVAYFIKALMEHDDDGMAALYNSTRFIVMPVICPSGIAHDPLLYPNSNNVRINKNFEYYGSWERLKNDRGGAYPDSEVETKALKYWLNKYAGSAFWLDCHSDTANSTIMKHLGTIFCSDSATASRLGASRQEVINFYINKGYITASDNAFLGFSAQLKATAIYPKTVYGLEVTRIPSAMMEQFEYSTAWGSNGNTNNDQYAIKHYVAMIRYMVLIMCRDDQKIIFD